MFSTKLISITKPEIKINDKDLTPEELIVYVARVSSPENQENLETAPKLLKYLIKNKHWSPLQMVDMTVEIVTSRAIAQQIIRHRSFSFQEFSQRYAKAQKHILYPARRQDIKNRQNSIDDLSGEDQKWFLEKQEEVWDKSNALYEEALKKGIAKECARFLLPLNTETRIYMKGEIRSWIHYFQVRCDNSAQKEHRDIAIEIRDKIFKANFPNIMEAL